MITFKKLLERAKTKSIAVHTPTKEQAITLLKMLDKMGFTWCDGDKLTTKTYYGDEKENTCYSFHKLYGKLIDKDIMYSPLEWFQAFGYKIIEFSEIDFEENKIMRLEKDQYGNCFKVVKGRYFIISLEEYNQLLKDMLEDE